MMTAHKPVALSGTGARGAGSAFIDPTGTPCLWLPLADSGLHWLTTADAYIELQKAYGPGLSFGLARKGTRGQLVIAHNPGGPRLPCVARLIGKAGRTQMVRCWNGNSLDLRPSNIAVLKQGTKIRVARAEWAASRASECH